MKFSTYLIEKQKNFSKIDILKIAIIIFVAVFFVGNFFPFYYGVDTLLYGTVAVNLANGEYEYENELLTETGNLDYIPKQWRKTIHNTAVPAGGVGIYGISTIAYLIGGYYGLFYLGPIFSILLLISSERIATNLFGRLAGLVVLILVASDFMINFLGRQLLTDNIFSLFLILGCYFLIKFFYEKRDIYILLGSIFLVTSAFFKYSGAIFFPVEIFILGLYFVYQYKTYQGKSNKKIKKFFKISIFVLIPWMIFLIFLFSYNNYYFGDPLTNYIDIKHIRQGQENEQLIPSFFKFDSERLTWIKFYSVGLLPDVIKNNIDKIIPNESSDNSDEWIRSFSLFILICILGISFYDRKKRRDVLVFVIFLIVLLLFFTSKYVTIGASSPDIQERYMVPGSIIIFILFGHMMNWVWKINFGRISDNHSQLISNILKGIFLVLLAVFLITSMYDSTPIKKIINGEFIFENPEKYSKRFPIDKEGLSKNSVIIGSHATRVIEYNAIALHPFSQYGTKGKLVPDLIPQEPIKELKRIMEQDYDVFAFKDLRKNDQDYFLYLLQFHKIILTDFSETFCKLEFVEKINGKISIDIKSDNPCYFPNKTLFLAP